MSEREGVMDEKGPERELMLAMAYADGELRGEERREFEALMGTRSDLRDEVSRLRRLEVLARAAAGPEPADFEWRALARDPSHRATTGAGWFALLVGALGVLGFVLWSLWSSDAHAVLKITVTSLVAGFTLLLAAAMRARRRLARHDPYSSIER